MGRGALSMVKIVRGLAASNKALKGLAVTVTFQGGESVQTEFYSVKDALLDWQRAQGQACAALELEYIAEESSWQQIEAFWLARIDRDHLIRSLFESVGKVELCLVAPAGNNIKKIGFELGGRSVMPNRD